MAKALIVESEPRTIKIKKVRFEGKSALSRVWGRPDAGFIDRPIARKWQIGIWMVRAGND